VHLSLRTKLRFNFFFNVPMNVTTEF
jgi:hypothetical protein